jgi:hypothetical protein
MHLKRTAGAVMALAFACTMADVASAQNTNSGDIRGVVTDTSGAVVPGANVEVKDVDKGEVHNYTTDGSGLYDTGSIVPDHYLITVSKTGFQTYVRGPISLDVSTVTVDAPLQIGQSAQQVVVNTDVPQLETETGAQSATLDSKELMQVPQVGADWQNLVTLQAGASSVIENNRGGQAASINGNLPYSSVLADGATTTLPMSQNSDVMVLDTVAEVKISDSAYSAQYGLGGVTFNQISKGGTNTFHGAVYEYFQNDALNAAPYNFNSTPPNPTVPVLRYNNFGGSVGGPILKDKLFFFFNFDKTIDNGGSAQAFETLPSAAVRSGDFTGLAPLYDPTTQVVNADGTVTRKTFQSEYGSNKIPAALLDPVAQKVLALYPLPNTVGTPQLDATNGITYTTNNFAYSAPVQNPFTKYFGRLDYNINQSHHMVISETESDNPAQFVNQNVCPINCEHGDVSRDNAQVSEVWTISPNLINEARFGFTDQLNFYGAFSTGEGLPAKIGLQFAKADIFPSFYINGNGQCCFNGNLAPATNAVYKEFVFDPSDVVTLIRGRHVLHFGGEFLITRADSTAWGNLNSGSFTYTGAYTAAGPGATGTTGEAIADFLLGETQNWNATNSQEYGGRLKSPQAFVQDDIKVKPNLTVNLGIRFQGLTGWHEVKGNMRDFDPTVLNPATNTLGAMWYGTTHANGRKSLEAPNYKSFLPRVGFSYQANQQTVLRGGFGLYGYTWSEDTYGPGLGNEFGASGNISDNTNGIQPVVILSSTGNTNYQGAAGQSVNSAYLTAPTGPAALNGQGVSYQAYHTPVPKIMQWNVQVQHTFGRNTVTSVAYVASHGYDLLFPVDINQVPEDKLSPNDATGSTNARPYPQFQGIGGGGSGGTNNSVSNYNSLQAAVDKRVSNGLQLSANYVWSHMLDTIDSSGWGSSAGTLGYQNAHDPGANYGPSNFDVHNAFKGYAIYDLPVGRGRQFLNNNRLLDEAIGGWQVAPSIIWTSGSPFTPIEPNNTSSYSQAGTLYPNVVGNPTPAKRTINNWYNTSAFAAPAPATFGDEKRNQLFGPNYLLANLALSKSFALTEKVKFELRGEANNFPNHASFGLPNTDVTGGSNITGTTVGGRTMQLYGRLSF